MTKIDRAARLKISPNPRSRSRVVVAEEDDVYRELLCEGLRSCGLCVQEARDGGELLDLLSRKSLWADGDCGFDLVIVNATLRYFQAIELLLRIHAGKTEIPLITITAYGERRAEVLRHEPQRISLEQEHFDLEGLVELVLDLIDHRRHPCSLRITLQPPALVSERAPTSTVFPANPGGEGRRCHSNLPPQIPSIF